MARNKSEKELRAQLTPARGGEIALRGGTTMATRPSPRYPWEGQVQHVAMYEKALTLDEIKKAYRGARLSISELEKAGIVRTTKSGKVYLAAQSQ